MKKPLLAAAFLLAATIVRAEIEFVGVMVTTYTTRVALKDTDTGHTSWVGIGEAFSGYKVSGYESATAMVVLQRDQAERRLRLRDDVKGQATRLELVGNITLGDGGRQEIERATLLFDQENVFPLANGLIYRITPTRREDGTHEFRLSIERHTGTGQNERLAAPGVITRPGYPFTLQVGDFVFAFKPRN